MHKFTKKTVLAGISCAALSLGATAAQAAVVYSNNFESNVLGAEWSGGGSIQGTQGYSAITGFDNLFLRNDTVSPIVASVLTLSGLAEHNQLDISVLLAVIDSWDSNNGSPSPDFFEILVDNVLVFQDTYANASGTVTNTAGLTDIGGGLVGRGFAGFSDRAYDFGTELQNIVHTASTMAITFRAAGAGWQGGGDESWAIDGLSVAIECVDCEPPVGNVPEPVTLSLLGAGLFGIGMARRRRV